MTWSKTTADFGVPGRRLTVNRNTATGKIAAKFFQGKGHAKEQEAAFHELIAKYRPELAGGNLVSIDFGDQGVWQFGYLHPSFPKVSNDENWPCEWLFEGVQDGEILRGLVKETTDIFPWREMLQKSIPQSFNYRLSVSKFPGNDGKCVLTISADVPCRETDAFARKWGEQTYVQLRECDTVVSQTDAMLPDHLFAEKVHGYLKAAVLSMANLSPEAAVGRGWEAQKPAVPEWDAVANKWVLPDSPIPATPMAPLAAATQAQTLGDFGFGVGRLPAGKLTISYFRDGSIETSNDEMERLRLWQGANGIEMNISLSRSGLVTEASQQKAGMVRGVLLWGMRQLAQALKPYGIEGHRSGLRPTGAGDLVAQLGQTWRTPTPTAVEELIQRVEAFRPNAVPPPST